jgi:hypothetical protein
MTTVHACLRDLHRCKNEAEQAKPDCHGCGSSAGMDLQGWHLFLVVTVAGGGRERNSCTASRAPLGRCTNPD